MWEWVVGMRVEGLHVCEGLGMWSLVDLSWCRQGWDGWTVQSVIDACWESISL